MTYFLSSNDFIQELHQELQCAIDDKENHKIQVQEYIKQVSNCEHTISQKVRNFIRFRCEMTNKNIDRLGSRSSNGFGTISKNE